MPAPTIPHYLHRFSLPTPFPVGPVNVYLAEGEHLTLIDTGPRYQPAREALQAGLNDVGYGVADLERILLTHAHADHCGRAAELAAGSGAEVWTHSANVHRLGHDGDTRRLASYAQVMHWAGVPAPVMMKLARTERGYHQYSEPLTPDHAVSDEDLLELGGEMWRVLHTPGHTGGLICLYQPERGLLISSDHLLQDVSSNPIVDPPPRGGSELPRRLVEYMTQLRRVADLAVTLALPGHGPAITDHRALIQKRLLFHEERARCILDTLDDETFTAYEIAGILFPDLDPVNTFLAISEVIGHLQWMEKEGRVRHIERLGVARWARDG